jgi:antitoxin VapB
LSFHNNELREFLLTITIAVVTLPLNSASTFPFSSDEPNIRFSAFERSQSEKAKPLFRCQPLISRVRTPTIFLSKGEKNMSIVIEDAQVEHLARELAKSKGVSVADVVRESLLSLAKNGSVAARPAPLRERLTALASEVDALPKRAPLDLRSDDEILGYNEHGTW